MKEQILHLDPHDDYVSARDKMGWVQTARVVLVWPPAARGGGPPLARQLDLVLLHRHAHRLGAQLALVTRDERIRDHAAALGLPVFESVGATRQMRWRTRMPKLRPDRRRPRPDVGRIRHDLFRQQTRRLPARVVLAWRALVFLGGVAALLALIAGLLPSATITLTPAAQPLAVTVPLRADPALQQPDLAAGLIPARQVRVEVQSTRLLPTTGRVEVPGARASGTVVFTNLAGTPAFIPQGVSVRTGAGTNVRFLTQTPANLEGRIGATVEVAVLAVEPGPAGNVGAALINTIDGPLGTQLAVTNPAPTADGSVQQRAAVAEADLTALRALVASELTRSAAEALAAQLQPGELMVSGTLTITNVLVESFDHAVGEPIDAVGLTLRLAASALAVDEAEARQVAEAALRAAVPAQAVLSPEPLRFTRTAEAELTATGEVALTLRAEGQVIPTLQRDAIRQLVRAQPVTAAAAQLQAALPLAAPPEIMVAPAWLGRWYPYLPWLAIRIEVLIR